MSGYQIAALLVWLVGFSFVALAWERMSERRGTVVLSAASLALTLCSLVLWQQRTPSQQTGQDQPEDTGPADDEGHPCAAGAGCAQIEEVAP